MSPGAPKRLLGGRELVVPPGAYDCRHPEGVPEIPVQEIFARAGADGWDAVRERYGAD